MYTPMQPRKRGDVNMEPVGHGNTRILTGYTQYLPKHCTTATTKKSDGSWKIFQRPYHGKNEPDFALDGPSSIVYIEVEPR